MLRLVDQDSKTRFSVQLRLGKYYIRANQGHSLPGVNIDMPVVELERCVHSTTRVNYLAIQDQGISRRSRLDIHMYREIRPSFRDCHIWIDAKQAILDGMIFRESENKVILSNGFDGWIPPRYFASVEFRPLPNGTTAHTGLAKFDRQD